jgi:hypothetical protein
MMMMTMTDGLSNPLLWIVIAMILDHALTTKTSSLMHCSTITQLVYDKSEGDSDCDYGLKNYRQHGVAVKQAHDKFFLKNRQTWHPRNHHQQVEWLNSLCPVQTLKKNISGWGG